MSVLATSAEIQDLAERAHATGRLGIDTEFMGEGRYRALLCLVQVSVEEDGVSTVWVIDPLDPDLDPTPLAGALADPSVEIVMHAARQDVALLRRTWRTSITTLFDTQLAAGFAGLRAQLGYEALLHELLGVRLGKTASYTRWDSRPLSDEQIGYAREDVLHLLQAATVLQERLGARGRLEWAREECRTLEEVSDERDPETIFARLPRIQGLDPRVRAVALALVEWREETARTQDRPAPSVLSDAALIEVARRRPATLEALEQIRGISEHVVRRRGRAIIAAVESGREREPIASDGQRPSPPEVHDAPIVALAEALVRARALDAELAYELIAARADLQRIVTAARNAEPEPVVRTLMGWRRELVGNELLALLEGRRSLTVTGRRRVIVSRSEDTGPPAD